MLYFLAPFLGWLVSGSMKFLIHYYQYGYKHALRKIGNGGFPSTHTTVVMTPTTLIGLNEGFFSPLFGLGITILWLVFIDATGLRRYVGEHAKRLNTLNRRFAAEDLNKLLREEVGHSKIEVLGGIILGFLLGLLINTLGN
ncbi:divergent PAP2 family protein [Peribacillus frigoritolerans]|uniref:divergent PAP2 family protein n=1 Tax=Peribacillus frigoritolerans TaxID=450367 RepID=UPI00105A14D7|nr:divergent PAP2 family protein [Peribacillus frigoritolerans]TDL76488.1 divergent PAP2 family protein [Peribacillus frigoritolerans]